MMFLPSSEIKVYIALGNTDMRKSINGLSLLVEHYLKLNPLSGSLFAFCNRKRNILKILYWDRNGFCLWHKRLEKNYFKWPAYESEVLAISNRELMWLLDGLDINNVNAHEKLKYSTIC